MSFLKKLSLSILAGIMISLGGAVFVSCVAIDNKIIGSVFFSLGLTVILLQGYNLFTGKTAYIFENKISYILDLLIIWVGNILGCMLAGITCYYASATIANTANELCLKKLTQTPLQTILLGALCGILVYIAVDYFKNNKDKHPLPKFLLVFTCVPVFIICGFEHSVADMFYFAASSDLLLYTKEGIVYILLVSLGNLVGAVLFHSLKKFALSQNEK